MSRTEKVAAIQDDLQAFSTYVYLFQEQIAEKMKLHPTDFHSVHLLDKYGALTAGQLAAQLGLTSGATTAVIDRLAGLGFAQRTTSDSDRRSTVVQLRPAGRQKIKREYRSVEKKIYDGLDKFSAAELETIARFLKAMTELG